NRSQGNLSDQKSTAITKNPNEITAAKGPKTEITPTAKTKTVEEKPMAQEKAEPTPPAPQLPTLMVHITPQFEVSLFIDGKEKSPDRRLEVQPGNHEIRIIHPDYPILMDTVDVTVDRNKEYNLAERFSGNMTQNFRIGLTPSDITNAFLQVSFNGKKHQYANEELPVLDLRKISGQWQVKFDIIPSGGNNTVFKIDSVVTFPYGGGPHLRLKANNPSIDFGAAEWQSIQSIDMLIYWSSR
ncbi:MAG: hypothetical protein NTV06_01400, partial [candidate division Zixibacteria bacterium]|nr:hypothetical protein [candidate division Zixibacteria bacterium]